MYIYLPIAEISMHIGIIIGLGGGVGFLSGLFGVGGGFLMTPLLIFFGVPPVVAVATEANQIVASSVSGVLAHMRRSNVDFKMGSILLVGGVIGSTLGVFLFAFLRELGQIDLVIKLSYVVLLGIVGSLMLAESIRAILRTRQPGAKRGKLHQHNWLRSALQNAVSPFQTLYFGSAPPRHWRLCRCVGRDHGCWGWLYHGAGNDLYSGHANGCCGWHFIVPDYLCYRQRDDFAVCSNPDR